MEIHLPLPAMAMRPGVSATSHFFASHTLEHYTPFMTVNQGFLRTFYAFFVIFFLFIHSFITQFLVSIHFTHIMLKERICSKVLRSQHTHCLYIFFFHKKSCVRLTQLKSKIKITQQLLLHYLHRQCGHLHGLRTLYLVQPRLVFVVQQPFLRCRQA